MSTTIKKLEPPDIHYLNAAEGWLGLGNTAEAQQELEKLSPETGTHPEVLRVRYHLYEKNRRWEQASEIAQLLCEALPESPFGWIHLAYALHELRRTREAYNVLIPVVDRFPEEYVMRYNLGCYSCQMGNLEEARAWLKKAVSLAGAETIKQMAITDPDLEKLRGELQHL
jgi:tetratricopeptide (TPR) repeat protein